MVFQMLVWSSFDVLALPVEARLATKSRFPVFFPRLLSNDQEDGESDPGEEQRN